MKRILPILLVLVLLAGCGNKDADETMQSTTQQPTLGLNNGLYVENSDIEQKTDGAVRLYDLGDMKVDWIGHVGDRILLVCQGDETNLAALSGNEGTVAASVTIPGQLTAFRATHNGFAYYDAEYKQAVYMDTQLQETQRHQLPGDVVGMPAFSPGGGEIFYCTQQGIYALDTQLGVTRPVRTHSSKDQTLLGCYLGGAMLACSIQDDNEQWRTLYISTETGEALSTDENILKIDDYDSTYFVTRLDGTVTQYIYGVDGRGGALQLNISEKNAQGASALVGAVGYSTGSDSLQMAFYHLPSGKKTGAVNIDSAIKPVQILADRWTGCVWILTEDNKLLRWDPDLSAIEQEQSYSGSVYSASVPDENGLEALQKRVDDINRNYGVTVRIWKAAVKSNNGYDLEPEYQTSAISKALDDLEAVMSEFPSKFLYKSVKRTIRICIVRSVGNEVDSAYYWFDKDPFIVLSAGVDIRQEFLRAYSYVLDIHVLGNSPLVDLWSELNPADFTYGTGDYDGNWLEDDTRAFVDENAMKSVIDDRASVFYQAMQPDNGDMFKSETMQAKLLQLCKAIRDAWLLEQKTETYLWEQYLAESIAYVE